MSCITTEHAANTALRSQKANSMAGFGANVGIVGFDKLAASLDELAGTLGKTADTFNKIADTFRQACRQFALTVLLLALIALLPLSSDDPACLLSPPAHRAITALSPPAHRAITALLAFTIACSASCLVGCLVPVRMLMLIALLHLHSSGLGEGGGGEGEGGGDFAWLLPLEIVALVGIVGPLVPPPVLQNLEYILVRFRRALPPPRPPPSLRAIVRPPPLPARQVQPHPLSLRHTIVRPLPPLPAHL